MQYRNRTCIDLYPNDEDDECFGQSEESQNCADIDCTGELYYYVVSKELSHFTV